MDLEKAIFGDKFHLLEQMETFLNKKFVGSGKSSEAEITLGIALQ